VILLSSTAGHGKSTTLAAVVHAINLERRCHILTLEEQVGIVHSPIQSIVTQRQIGEHCPGWPDGIASARSLDAEIIAIDQLRDSEAIEAAFLAADAGRLVIAAMSAPSGVRAIDSLLDLVVPAKQTACRALLENNLRGVLFQRLLPRTDGQGRVAACEYLIGSKTLGRLIREDKMAQLPGLMQRGRTLGMVRLEDSVPELLQQGAIDSATAKRLLAASRFAKQAPAAQADNGASYDVASDDNGRDGKSLVGRMGGLFKRKGK
jgi:twitching motility protein PilT